MNKFGDEVTDYAMTIRHQMDTWVRVPEKSGGEVKVVKDAKVVKDSGLAKTSREHPHLCI